MYERAELPDVVALYDDTRQRIGRFLDEAGPGLDEVLVPACPDWTVADLSAHLAGAPVALLDRDLPGDDTQRWVDGHVEARRGRSARENWLEWDAVGPAYGALLAKNEPAWGSLLYDAIIHEDDLRGAVGAPPARDAVAIDYAIDRLLWRLDGLATDRGLGSFRVHSGERTWAIELTGPSLELRCDDTWELMRSLASRRSERRVRSLQFSGDPSAWISIAPDVLPTDDAVD